MIAQSEAQAPREACGLLTGQDRIVRDICSSESGGAVEECRQAGQEVLAVYRSRPGTPARPVAEDLRMALPSNAVCLLLSLVEPWRPELRGYRIHGGASVEVPITVFDDQDYEPGQDYVI